MREARKSGILCRVCSLLGLLGTVAGVAWAQDSPGGEPKPASAPDRSSRPDIQPRLLGRPIDAPKQPSPSQTDATFEPNSIFLQPMEPTTGYAGPSGVLPTEEAESSHFVPVEDRWRIGYPCLLYTSPSPRD